MIPGKVNILAISKLKEPVKAILAYYSAVGGSNCTSSTCDLTTALGLGEQGSSKQINLLTKWFKEDKGVQLLVAQKCYQPPNTSSLFSDFQYLKIELKDSIVIVKYSLFLYNHGKESFILSDNDSFTIKKDKILTNHRKV